MFLPETVCSALQTGFQCVCSPSLITSVQHVAEPRLGDLQTTVMPRDQHLTVLILVLGVLFLTAPLWAIFHQDGCRRFSGVLFANLAKHLDLPTIAEYTKSGKG